MLCQFTVKNYRCIKNEAMLSLAAVESLSEHRDSLIVDRDGNSFLPLSVIYGPNGGGKSTVLDALYSVCYKVINPVIVATDDLRPQQSDSFSRFIIPLFI